MENESEENGNELPVRRDLMSKGEDRLDFEKEHEEELGLKRYAYVSARDFFIPLAATAAGGVAGYYGLRAPVKALVKENWLNNANGLQHLATKITAKTSEEKKEILRRVSKEFPDLLSDIKPTDTLLGVAERGWSKITSPDQKKKFWNALDIGEIEPFWENWIGAGAGAFAASLGTGIFMGYENWKDEEMPKIAAREVGKDISNLQLFKPTDLELQNEVIRLRGMVDELQEKNNKNEHEPDKKSDVNDKKEDKEAETSLAAEAAMISGSSDHKQALSV